MDDFLRKARIAIRTVQRARADATKAQEDPPPWLVALPLVYDAINRSGNVDQYAVSLVGQYLTNKFPSMKNHFRSKEQEQTLRELKRAIDDVV